MRCALLLLSLVLAFPTAAQSTPATQKPGKTIPVKKGARFVSQPDGKLVDTRATPKGSYIQPGGGRTDILQGEDHGAGLSHTHDPATNVNPKTGQKFINRLQKPGRKVSSEDVQNIKTGKTIPATPKGR